MIKSAKFSFALSLILALCVVVAIAKTSGSPPASGKFTNYSVKAGKDTTNVSQFDGGPCPCNLGRIQPMSLNLMVGLVLVIM